MPIIEKIEDQHCKIAIWKIDESLKKLIVLSNKQVVLKCKNEKRKKELLATKLLLEKLLPNAQLFYNEYGAPELEKNNFISISHSKGLIGIIISKLKVGLDIEKINNQPLILSSKFIKKTRHNPLSEEKATLIWCCKEAIFKWYQKGNINFACDIIIKPFLIKNNGTLVAEFKNQELILCYKKINSHFLAYVCR